RGERVLPAPHGRHAGRGDAPLDPALRGARDAVDPRCLARVEGRRPLLDPPPPARAAPRAGAGGGGPLVDSRTIETRGGRSKVRVYEGGRGEPLVFPHGAR